MNSLPVETLKVGDPIRVLNIETDRMHNGTVAALWPDAKAISVDVRKGKRIYFRSSCMDQWYLPDMEQRPEPTIGEDVDLGDLIG
jgi:hypothetical protein